ncbi:HDOD domain-containing protein [Marinobacter sp. es.042]|uniref:response regulator n=1 Tax=Marinobacter sp. es.042 TaxID=1761794 RepID=UPI000B5015B3|nr:response regulator [Marinobacter sp. es.042]SNB58880.1 HDOD domain-containing protein [Marinobacter sp. es.042]
MNVIIVEDDELMADLLETVVVGLHPAINVFKAFTKREALDLWRGKDPGLFIVDWSLPDGSGLDVLREIRGKDENMPVVMVTGRADRDSILKAAHYGISGYMSKPFSVELLHERLSRMLKGVLPEDNGSESLDEMLSRKLESGLQIPTRMDVSGILGLMERAHDLSGAQLAERWQKEASLCARLLEVANRSSFRRTGEPVATVRDAISVMGVPMALSQALALALDTGSAFRSAALADRARQHQAEAEAAGAEAQKVALLLDKKALEFQTAGLLSRMGELAVLNVMDQFIQQGGELTDAEIENGLRDWSQKYGNTLKVQWRLPLAIRQMTGAVHYLAREDVRQNLLVMRVAGLIAGGQTDNPECARLLRHLGLENWLESRKQTLDTGSV